MPDEKSAEFNTQGISTAEEQTRVAAKKPCEVTAPPLAKIPLISILNEQNFLPKMAEPNQLFSVEDTPPHKQKATIDYSKIQQNTKLPI